MDNFVHLHGHTEYSSLDGFCRVKGLVERAVELEQPSLAITDHGSLSGVYKFVSECHKNNIKPIVGVELYMTANLNLKKTPNHITLLAQSKKGWENLIKLHKQASHQVYYKPRVSFDDLERYSENLICLSGCLKGVVCEALLKGEGALAHKYLDRFVSIFGDRFYIEIMDHGLESQKQVNAVLREWSERNQVAKVATNDFHYIRKRDAKYQDMLLCDQMKKDLDDPKRMKFGCDEFYLKPRSEMKCESDELDQTLEIADKCDLSFSRSRFFLPQKEDDYDNLVALIYEAIDKKGWSEEFFREFYRERLNKELSIIKEAGLIGYFLIVADYVQYAKENDVLVGPGRGSVGGCLVAYLLGIHDVDPIKYNLLFNRFYNEGRKGSLPDIDIDFPEQASDMMIDYIVEKYGQNRVCHIGTFMKLKIKGAVKLVCRVRKVDFQMANYYATICEDEKQSNELAHKSIEYKRILNEAKNFVDLTTHHSIHAAGIVIADKDIDDLIPVHWDQKANCYVSSWDMHDVENVGFVKFDFLSLTTLDIVQETFKMVGITQSDIPNYDESAYQLINTTNCTGVFQLGAQSGIDKLANNMQCNSVEDIAAVLSLYRPGPLGSKLDKKYIDRKNGLEEITYLHPKLKEVLKDTYGLMIYQEQIIQTCMTLAGFSESEADNLRKGIGKKLPELIDKMKDKFISGCVDNQVDQLIAEEIWGQILEFADYGFNKSHAVGYALLSYTTAYLKAHYPIQFMASTLNYTYNNPDKLSMYLQNCRAMGIEVLPPSINYGEASFSVKDGKIIFGLKAIKGVGEEAAKQIKKKKYKSFDDFIFSYEPAQDELTALIEAGAFDEMGHTRKQLLSVVQNASSMVKQNKKTQKAKKRFIVEAKPSIMLPDIGEFSDDILAQKEYDRLNAYIVFNPIKDKILVTPREAEGVFVIGGFLQKVKARMTKKSKKLMAFGEIVTELGTFEILFFPKTYKENQEIISAGNTVTVKVEREDNTLLVREVYR